MGSSGRLQVRLGLIAVASPLEVGAEWAPELLRAAGTALASAQGVHLVTGGVVDRPAAAREAGVVFRREAVDAVVAVAASWFEDYLVADALEEWHVPAILWAVPGMETGSLCGQQQAAFLLSQLGWPCRLVFAPVRSVVALTELLPYARAAALWQRLRRARIGLIGHRVLGMTETAADELSLRRQLGPRVIHLDVSELAAEAGKVPEEDARRVWEKARAEVGSVRCHEQDGIESCRMFLALQELVQRLELSALAVGCYPHLMGKVCVAASMLGEQGVPVACEGDVNGAVAMLVLALLSGEPVHNTDMLDPLPEENAIVFSHCGSGAFSLASDRQEIVLAPVRLMHRGVSCLFPARPGEVTLVNLVAGTGGYLFGVLHGEALSTQMVFPGNPLKVRFGSPYERIVEWVVQQGLGHHWMAAYGDHRAELRFLARLCGCRLVEIC